MGTSVGSEVTIEDITDPTAATDDEVHEQSDVGKLVS